MSKNQLHSKMNRMGGFLRVQIDRLWRIITILTFLISMVGMPTTVAKAAGISVGFETGWTDHTYIDTNADWYSANNLYVEDNAGVGGTWGLATSGNIFTWMGHPFQWSDPTLTGVLFGMDFQTNGSSAFDDDRIGWMIAGNSTNSDYEFGVQLDPGGSGQNIEAYWDGNAFGDDGGRTSIVSLSGLSANAWYRLRAEITKLTDTSAKIDVTLTALNADGSLGSVVASGSIPDTDLLPNTAGNEIPNEGYFTATTMYPAFKNHNGSAGYADNAYFEILTGTPSPVITIAGTPLDAFGSEPGTPSTEQSYTVSGSNLTEDISITAPADFEISTTSGGGFGSSVTLGQSGGMVTDTLIYVRFNRADEGTSSGIITHTSAGATAQNVAVSGTAAVPLTGWVAYNDMDVYNGDSNAVNVTEHSYTTTNGALVDYSTGTTLPVTTTGSCVNASGTTVSCDANYTDGGQANALTDAANAFGVTGSVIVDLADMVQINDAGYDDFITFNNLDPAKAYTITLTANRNNPSYANMRYSKVTIQGADTYVNASSSGVEVNSADSVSFSVGYNTVNGYVAKWTGITSGSDGSFSIKSEWDSSLGSGGSNTKGYAMTAFKLEETGDAPEQYTLTTSATGSGSITLDPVGGIYSDGTVVQVAAVPDAGATFLGWSGDLDGMTNPASITMDGDKTVTAIFTTASETTVTFQYGVSGYTGTVDTFIRGTTEGNTNFSANTGLEWDENTGTTTDEIALIRFTDIFSSEGGPIPDGATITSASLQYTTTDLNSGSTANGDPANVYESLVDWPGATVTWNNFGGEAGVQTDEYHSTLVDEAIATAISTQYTIDVTTSLQRWSDGTANYGWVFLPTAGDGVTIYSSDHATVSYHPLLTVTYATSTTNHAPDQPVLVQPADEAAGVSTSPTLEVTVSDSDIDSMDVSFYGRSNGTAVGEDFMLVVIPDTQNAATSYPAVFNSMTQWIADNKTTENIIFATSVGDIVNTASSTTEWTRADAAYAILDAADVAYSVGPGNHDLGGLYETYFGVSRFSSKSYYGGHYGSDNLNNYSFFSAGGMDFILINLQYNPTTAQLDWADQLLKVNDDRRGIVVQHNILNTDNSWNSQTSFTALKDNPNLFLMLCGHMHTSSDGAAYRAESGDDGHTVHIVMADYQDYPNGGNGFLRLLRFSPADDMVYMTTYSPYTGGSLTTSPDQMNLVYDMEGGSSSTYTLIDAVNGVANGTNASISWPGLSDSTEYEWYATVFDGSLTTTGSVWSFTTAASSTCYQLTLGHTGLGVDPVATPANSTGCAAGYYVEGQAISLSGATPAIGSHITGWTGTSNNGSTAATNSLSMPAAAHSAGVNYAKDSVTLTVNKVGSGTVNQSPASPYLYGDVVTLTAVPDTGWHFAGWSGGLTGTTNPDSITLDGNKTVSATFEKDTVTLTVNKVGSGNVNLTPAGPYLYGDSVTLTAVSATGWTFTGWSGDLSGSVNPESITLNGNKTVTATFEPLCYTLTTSVDPLASGTITANPAPNCNGGTQYTYGTDVELTAVAGSGYGFDHWTGSLSGSTNPQTVTMNTAKSVTAVFAANAVSLTVNVTGSGTVTQNPAGPYYIDDVVQLTAVPATGWHFANWTGDLSGSDNPASITLTGNKTVTAVFAKDSVTLTVNVTGSGTVTQTPAGPYLYGDSVALTPVPTTGWHFVNWTGDLTSTDNPGNIVLDGTKTVTAVFAKDSVTLTVNVTGSGTVTQIPAGPYLYGDSVTLTPVPATGWHFVSWSGDLTGTDNPGTIALNGNKTVTAVFVKDTVTLTVNVTGSGTVTQSPAAPYSYGDSVTLTPVPASGWQFANWSGDLTGTDNPGTIVLNGNKTITAVFTEIPVTNLVCENFNSFTTGSRIGTYTGWYDGGNGPMVTAGNGVASSVGLAAANNIFNWTAHPFNWNASNFESVTLQADYKTSSSGQFDDDRLAWSTNGSSTDSANQFGVQLDHSEGGISTYWRNSSNTRVQTTITSLPTLPADTWYRFKVEITKLTATSASLDITLTQLDASGNPTGTPYTGSVPNTSTWSGGAPATSYFTGISMVPSYKTYTTQPGPADNTCFEVKTGTPPPQYTLTVNTDGHGSVTLNPAGGTYDEGTVVQLTAVPNTGYAFSAWGGNLSGSTNPTTITMDGNKTVTASFAVSTEATVTFQNGASGYTGTVDTHIMEDEETTDHGALESVEWDNDDPSGTGLDKFALLRFDNIYGSGAGQIPLGATIQSATLRYVVFNTGAAADVNEVAVGWTESETWNGFGGEAGVQADEYGTARGSASGTANGVQSVDVTASLVAWANSPSSNRGWIFRPTGTDGVDFRSSEYATVADRPSLEVTYSTNTVTQYTLTVNAGANGSVTLNPTGGTYPAGMVVQLTAVPNTGYAFSGWSGALSGTTNPITITMDGNKTVGAAFSQLQQFTLTTNVVGNGSITLNPAGGTYPQDTVVQLTAVPATGYVFSSWSGDLTGSTNPTSITMNAAKTVTAIFTELPPQPAGVCADFESGYTVGQVIGTHTDWFDSGSGPVVNDTNGLLGSNGLAPASSIFTWNAHPFKWSDPGFESITFRMDYQTNASGYFDDDRMGWMTTTANADSANFFGVQLDTVSGGDGGIVTYWRDDTDTRIQTPIVDLASLTANTWYRLETTITKLTDTSARIDVSLVRLDASGNPTGTAYTGTLDDTSAWADGAPNEDYFTATNMWPAYKNHNGTTGAADNVCYDISSGRFAFLVSTDWHTSDSNPNADITAKAQQIANWVNNPTSDMPAPEFMVITGDFPNLSQTEGIIDAQLGSDFLWYPVIGNHEVSDDINNFYAIRDTVVPSLPNIVDDGPTGSVNTTYSFDYENSHFVVVNPFWDGASNDHTSGGDIPTALNTWVNADLTTNDASHEFVFIHTPPYPENRHVGEDLDANPANRNAFITTLNSQGVEAIFSGHTHYYEHNTAADYPLLGDVTQITNGSLRSGGVPVTVTYVLVEGSTTTYKVYSWNGSSFTLLEQWTAGGSEPTQPPTAPTALNAVATSYARVDLAWTDNADNESGFEIERSTTGSGGTFSLLTTVPADTESYANIGLTGNSEYCYRVRAVNSAGNSTYSNVDCETTPTQPPLVGVCESFDSGFTIGQPVGNHADWYDGGAGPVVTSGNGVASSVGLAPAANIFTWNAQPFNWNDSAFQSVNFKMDFQTDASGQFDDDRMGWMTTSNSTDSNNIFGAQLDHADGGIVTYWRNSSGTRIQTPIVALPTLTASTWYRFQMDVTKLTATSAKIDVSLVRLDASGNPTGTSYTGTVPNTSTWSGGAPVASYFTAATLWPAYKNHNAITGAADNACYEAVTGLNTIITSNPSNPSKDTSAVFTFTSTESGATFECQLDGGGFGACSSPMMYVNLNNGSHTFQVRAIGATQTDATPASYTWTVNTALSDSLVGYWRFDESSGTTADDSSTYGNDGTVANGATWTTGKENGALSLDGADDNVALPVNSSLSLSTNQVTFAGWVYPTGTPSWSTIMQRSNAAGNWFDWQLYARASDAPTSDHPVFRVDWNNNRAIDSGEEVQGDIILQTNTWYFIAVTYDGTAMKFYIDGTLRGTTAKSGGVIPNSNEAIWLGGNDLWGEYFAGKMDEFRIYNQALNQSEIQALMTPPTCYALTLSHAGQGSDPAALPSNSFGCPVGQYVAGATVNVGGSVPASGWQISGWTGTNNDASVANTNVVTMPAAAHTVSVNYTQTVTTCYALTLSHTGQGNDPVASPSNSTGCSTGQYLAGATINLSGAVPATGWQIAGWTGTNNDASTANTNVLTMPAAARAVSVNYTQSASTCYTLTLSHTGQGSDPVASPANSTGCSAGQYLAGATINLSGAVPAAGWQIAGWTGTNNDASIANTNVLTMPAAAHTVSVDYSEIVPVCRALTLTHTGQGSDPVASPASSAGCSTGQYLAGETINLSGAVPATDWQIFGWTGTNNDDGTANTNIVTMPASIHTVSVDYIHVPWPLGDIGADYNPVYVWDKVVDATWYRLYISGPSGVVLDKWFEALSICGDFVCSVTTDPETTLGGGDYAWYVQPYTPAGYGSWSARNDFNTTMPTAPGAAALTEPKGDIGANYTPTYKWGKVETATYYRIYVAGQSGVVLDQWYKSADICDATTCSVTSPELAGGDYAWYVQTYNSAGYGPWSNTDANGVVQPTNFNTAITLPVAAVLTEPLGSIGMNFYPAYKWGNVATATYYRLYVSGPSGVILDQWYKSADICDATTCSVPSPRIEVGDYAWYVQTWSPAGYGPWSNTDANGVVQPANFNTVAPALPVAAVLTAPIGDIGVNFTPDYVWNKVDGALYYRLYVSGPSGMVLDQWYEALGICDATTCTVPSPQLEGGAHAWYVQTWNPAGYGPWSNTDANGVVQPTNFATTTTPPAAAILTAPKGDVGTNYTPTYTWDKVTGATYYRLYVGGANGVVLDQWYKSVDICTTTTCSVASPVLTGGDYAWYVQTWNPAGYGPWSNTDANGVVQPTNFSATIPSVPAAAVLTAPKGDIGTDYNPVYTWGKVDTASYYRIYVSGPSGVVLDQWYKAVDICGASTCSVTSPTLGGGAHVWYVQTYNESGYGPWSNTDANGVVQPTDFITTTPTIPAGAVLTAPKGTITTLTPTFSWNKVSMATWYRLYVKGPYGVVKDQWVQAVNICNTTACSVPGITLTNGDHTWWVQTYSSAGYGPWMSSNFKVSP